MAQSAIRHETVRAGQQGQRLDNWLMGRLKGVPRSMVYRLLRTGQVRVNGGRAKPHLRLQAGDEIRIPPVRRGADKQPPKADAERVARLMRGVLYEDERVLVLDKPAGQAVHAGSGIRHGLIETINAARPGAELHLVHRLDRDTSGCLLLAKQPETLRDLHRLMRQGSVAKHYLALVAGDWPQPATVEAALASDRLRGGERMVEAVGEGRRAVTHFKPLAHYRGATLVEAVLDTGRKHQIRVHAAHAGHPVGGDRKYGDDAFNARLRENGLKRLFLHAHRLELTMPDGRDVDVGSPLPDDLRAVLDEMEYP